MSLIEKARAFLQGKKTYLVSALAVLSALLAFSSGNAGLFETLQAILLATGLGTLRAGVTTEAAK